MEIITKTKEIFEVNGIEFFDKKSALEYLSKIKKSNKILESLEVYHILGDFDATEGRGYFKKVTVLTDLRPCYVIQYAIKRFGYPIQKWYGDSVYVSWILDGPLEMPVSDAIDQIKK